MRWLRRAADAARGDQSKQCELRHAGVWENLGQFGKSQRHPLLREPQGSGYAQDRSAKEHVSRMVFLGNDAPLYGGESQARPATGGQEIPVREEVLAWATPASKSVSLGRHWTIRFCSDAMRIR